MFNVKTTVALIFSLLILSQFCGCGGDKKDTGPIIRSVRYQSVYASGGSRIRSFSGVAKAGVESKLSFRVAGVIEKLPVKVGDRVKAGQIIAELDPTDYELRVAEAEAALQQARAQARNAAANFDRISALWENRNVSLNDLDAARAAHESARAALKSAEKQLEQARLQHEYTKLKAPVDGAIADLMVEINENVKVGGVIALLTAGSQLEVDVDIPGILISQIREGDRVNVTFDAMPESKIPGTISEVGVAATSQGTTFPVTVVLNQKNPDIRSGMAAQVAFEFKSGEEKERILVPPVAVGEDRKGRFVFVVEGEEPGFGIVHRREVIVGELSDDGLEIKDGLADGEWLVTAGVTQITDGQKVRLPKGEGQVP
jgi:RND family efflux transporter MFP subunit